MALLNVSNIKKSYGTDLIFEGVSFEIGSGEHVGLVGVNGSGKTTLFKLLNGLESPDSGSIFRASGLTIGYMEQHVLREESVTVYDEVLTVFAALSKLESELEALHDRIDRGDGDLAALVERQSLLTDRHVRDGGLTYKSRARAALLGLGFTEEQLSQPVGTLSGGQKAKVQLAKMLLSGAGLLLLDEPTNHLDIPSVEWLEDFLRSHSGAYVVVSHDRYFLDRVTARTFELEHRKMTIYSGNYSLFLEKKEALKKDTQKKYETTRREISRIEGIVAQQRQWNRERNIRTAESKLKAIGRLEQDLERPDTNPESIRFSFGIRKTGGNDVLDAERLSLSFSEPLFADASLHVRRGERVFLIGPNGCGKTSLLKSLLGLYTPDSGTIRFGAGIETGYYDQIQSNLHPEKTVIDEVWDRYPSLTQTEIRNALAVFLFKGDDVFKKVETLSGGERARVLLLKLMLSKSNFLLMDEPTNHLDITSREALENALSAHEGTLFIVSHDRYLINKMADRLYCLDGGCLTEYQGNYDDYLSRVRPAEDSPAQKAKPKQNEYKERKLREAEERKKKSRIKRLEEAMEALEEEIKALEAQLSLDCVACDYEKTLALSGELHDKTLQYDGLFAEWGELSESEIPS